MGNEIVYTDKATSPTAHYSQAIKTGNTIYLAGLCGDNPATGEIMGNGDIRIETKWAMKNLRYTIEAAGGSISDIVKVNVYVKDIKQMNKFDEIYKQYFEERPPARIAMQISDLAGGASLELDAIAVLQDKTSV